MAGKVNNKRKAEPEDGGRDDKGERPGTSGSTEVLARPKRAKRTEHPKEHVDDSSSRAMLEDPGPDPPVGRTGPSRTSSSRKEKVSSSPAVRDLGAAQPYKPTDQPGDDPQEPPSRTARKGSLSQPPSGAPSSGVAQGKGGGQRHHMRAHAPEVSDHKIPASRKRAASSTVEANGESVVRKLSGHPAMESLRMDGYKEEVAMPSRSNNSRLTAGPEAQHKDLTKEQLTAGWQKVNNKLVISDQRKKETSVATAPMRRAKTEGPVRANSREVIHELEAFWGAELANVLNKKYWPRICNEDQAYTNSEYAKLDCLPDISLDIGLLSGLLSWARMSGMENRSAAIDKLDAAVESRMVKNKSSPLLSMPRYEVSDVDMVIKNYNAGKNEDSRAWKMGQNGASVEHAVDKVMGGASMSIKGKMTKKQIREMQ